jgi:hypothetical protein
VSVHERDLAARSAADCALVYLHYDSALAVTEPDSAARYLASKERRRAKAALIKAVKEYAHTAKGAEA